MFGNGTMLSARHINFHYQCLTVWLKPLLSSIKIITALNSSGLSWKFRVRTAQEIQLGKGWEGKCDMLKCDALLQVTDMYCEESDGSAL